MITLQPETNIETAHRYLCGHENLIIIDVRSEEECVNGVLPNAYHIDLASIDKKIGKYATNLNDPILVYCDRGARATLAAHQLQQLGYTNVSALTDGFRAWFNAGLPVEGETTLTY